MKTRVIALILAVLLCLSLFAGCSTKKTEEGAKKPTSSNEPAAKKETESKKDEPAKTDDSKKEENKDTEQTETVEETDKPLFDTLTTIKLTCASHANYDVSKCYILDVMKEQENIDLQITALEEGTISEQYALLIADNKIPDVTCLSSDSFGKEYGPLGAYINFVDYLDQMPNLKAALEENPAWRDRWVNEDGSMYSIPCIRINGDDTVYSFFYRSDVFDANGLSWPTTQDEFVAVLRKLKELYPESYPFCVRTMTGAMQTVVFMSTMFGTKFAFPGQLKTVVDYDWNTESWFNGAISDEMKEYCEFMKMLLDEGLMHPSSLNGNGHWEDAFASGTSFIGFDKANRLSAVLNPAGQALTPGFRLVGASPIGFGTNGAPTVEAPATTSHNYMVSSQAENLDEILTYLDWLYTMEGMAVTNYGKEGETFEYDENGYPQWIESAAADPDPREGRGIGITGHYGLYDFNSYLATCDEIIMESFANITPYCTTQRTPIPRYNEAEQEIYDSYGIAMHEYEKMNIAKFILGERDLAEWDMYVKEVETTYHGKDVLAAVESAWARMNQ